MTCHFQGMVNLQLNSVPLMIFYSGEREQSGESNGWFRTENYRMSNKLFVGNLSFDVTEAQLRDEFAAHGVVTEVNLMMDRDTGRPRGFGFITMNTPEEAQAAIGALNGKSIDGRALTVNVARPREERPPGGGGRRVNTVAAAGGVAIDPPQGFLGGVRVNRASPFCFRAASCLPVRGMPLPIAGRLSTESAYERTAH